MVRNLHQLIIRNNTHPNDVNDNDKYPNNINNIDTDKNSDIGKNDMLCNDINNSNTNPDNFKNNGSENDNINNIDTENNIDNVELCYNWKRREIIHQIQKYGKYFPYAIQFIQKSNTNIFRRKFKHIDIRTKQHNTKI